jgi:Fur family ferric uptake transcriptional regulator
MHDARWEEHALAALRGAGHRSGGARQRVVRLLAGEPCAMTALEIDRRLHGVGRASVYRTLEQLGRLGLVQRLDVGSDAAGYERVSPGGDHHHHIVCEGCGRLEPFNDPKLERAVAAVARTSEFEVRGHEVVLRGSCADCSGAG